ncbi:hypothetical protein X797_006239 [Metarhizium robertsii]|uniref:Uncharacterized protein n=2 Tax=Metarhizium robertsii TaxID=568076 RepID=E9F5B7_METRA|nr:uncharacterized protein MAA_07466 [Metarhizium robertsii ARSEF 23]EFY97170.1 hypothetical protein MAA_07466 [Metarhizium robertsii ARSEF 23]EXV00523.1 hypothetical protein X797_006239 [Metarhizium robertsii]
MLRPTLHRCAHASGRLARDHAAKATAGGGVGAKGRAAGGQDLGSTAEGSPRKPKVFNFSTPGAPGDDKGLSEAQRREVDEHNREFERTHDGGGGGGEGPENMVDGRFWGDKGRNKGGKE